MAGGSNGASTPPSPDVGRLPLYGAAICRNQSKCYHGIRLPQGKSRAMSREMKEVAVDKEHPAGDGTRNSAATITKIIAAAEAEFGTKGLDGAKVENIARAAGVSKQLIYHYFEGKDDLYAEMLAQIARVNYEKLLEVDYEALDPQEAIRGYLLALYDQYNSHPISAVITVDQGLHAGAQIRQDRDVKRLRIMFRERLGWALARGQQSGDFTTEIDVEMLHFLSVVMTTGCLSLREMFTRYAGGMEHEEAFWRRYITDFFLRALRS